MGAKDRSMAVAVFLIFLGAVRSSAADCLMSATHLRAAGTALGVCASDYLEVALS